MFLTRENLIDGLEYFSNGEYHTLSVFIDDVNLDDISELYSTEHQIYEIQVVQEKGIIKVTRYIDDPSQYDIPELVGWGCSSKVNSFPNIIIRSGISAYKDCKLILGLLIGNEIGDSGSHYIFCLQYDQDNLKWKCYDGGLVSWMKEVLFTESSKQ